VAQKSRRTARRLQQAEQDADADSGSVTCNIDGGGNTDTLTTAGAPAQ
jgi:hypothetical protein